MKNEFFAQVSEFNREVIGFIQPSTPEMLSKDVKELTAIQLREEIVELEDATTVTEEVDALTDLIYFAMGALYKIGLYEDMFSVISSIVHNANMTKAAGKKATRGYEGSAVDAYKPEDFVPPEEVFYRILQDKVFHKKLMTKESNNAN